MGVAEKMLEELKTPEGEAKMRAWMEEYIEQENVKNEQIRVMMSNTSYLDWLIEFTQNHESFADDDWLYCPDEIKDYDKENVKKLCLFYTGIARYANSNYIDPTECVGHGDFYRIKSKEIGFEIGTLMGQGTVFFCNRVEVNAEINKEQEFIDFNDIMTSKKQEKTNQINANLDSLSDKVLTVYKAGVPIEAIVNTLENTIQKIVTQEKDQARSLTRNKQC